MIKRAATAAAAAAVLVTLAGAGTASAQPSTNRLPDADMLCPGSDPLNSSQWVSLPGSDTLWLNEGPLAGHYLILSDSHYVVPGLVPADELSTDGLEPVQTLSRGAKTGLADGAITCEFVSHWDFPGTVDDMTVFGPITMVRVNG